MLLNEQRNSLRRPTIPSDANEQSADWQPRNSLGPIPLTDRPAEAVSSTKSTPWRLERWLASRMLRRLSFPHLAVQLWDGTLISSGSTSPSTYRVHFRTRSALWNVLMNPAFHFPEGYARGQIEFEGDLLGLLCEVNHQWRRHPLRMPRTWFYHWRASRCRNSLAGSRHNVERHYDLGNDFYRLWLDENLVYTCAYFPRRGMTLAAAQVAKLDHVCRKLDLRPDETVIEAGCGWGALALHMAKHYGVRVRAYNISVEQLAYARSRAKELGLADRVEFIQEDWRNMRGNCDAFVSVGMLEHVGPEHFPTLGRVIQQCLSPHGRGLIHSIGQNFPLPLNPWIERQIFPGAEPPALEQIARIFPAGDLTVLDVENLRLHYAETLWHWLHRFEQSVDAIRPRYGDEFIRKWRLYLAISYSAFETGGLQLFQVVFAPTGSNRISRSRADWYRAEVSASTESVRG